MPNLIGRFVNVRTVPDMSTVTFRAMAQSERTRRRGTTKCDWRYLLEIHVVNDSETSVTVDDVEVEVVMRDILGNKHIAVARVVDDMSAFKKDMSFDFEGNDIPWDGERYVELTNLLEQLRGVSLERGVGYRGWLRIDVKDLTELEVNERVSVSVWLIDAFHGKHEIHFKRNSDKKWDRGFMIVEDAAPKGRAGA